ncbi:MAG: hypothetical protein HZA48_00490 [Planctomycetes bacterium]|nr:hypothetical protein [Planctomycetota bacterium]
MPDSKPVTTINAAILIIDGMESTTIANVWGPEKYDKDYLQQLHYCYRSVLCSIGCVKPLDNVDEPLSLPNFPDVEKLRSNFHAKWSGDEFCAVFHGGDAVLDIGSALTVAGETVLRWFQRPPNCERINSHQDPFYLSCGIYYGPVTFSDRPTLEESFQKLPEGIAFAYAKRLQSKAKKGKWTNIYITDEIVQFLPEIKEKFNFTFDIETEEKGFEELKGPVNKRLHEIKFIFPANMIVTADQLGTLYNLFIQRPIHIGFGCYIYLFLSIIGIDDKYLQRLNNAFKNLLGKSLEEFLLGENGFYNRIKRNNMPILNDQIMLMLYVYLVIKKRGETVQIDEEFKKKLGFSINSRLKEHLNTFNQISKIDIISLVYYQWLLSTNDLILISNLNNTLKNNLDNYLTTLLSKLAKSKSQLSIRGS